MHFLTYVIMCLLASVTAAWSQGNDLSNALATCQKDSDTKARIACYEAVKDIQIIRENPFLKALQKNGSNKKAKVSSNKKSKKSLNKKFSETAITVKLLKKEFRPSDSSAGRFEAFLNLQLAFAAKGIKKPTRAIKGSVAFTDLFDEVMLRIGWTLDDPMIPNQTLKYLDQGIKLNQFNKKHQWLKNTDAEDMKVRYEINQIIYADGEKWRSPK
jgi:hypothetical protein